MKVKEGIRRISRNPYFYIFVVFEIIAIVVALDQAKKYPEVPLWIWIGLAVVTFLLIGWVAASFFATDIRLKRRRYL